MTVAKNPDAYETGEAPTWAWPVYAFVAWLATMLGYVARFKRIRRTHRFKPDWRDSWPDLVHSEWLRDQMIAQGLAQLLANQPLQLDDTKIELTPPATYGGPCPRSPFEMNRRFIALARWAADPEAIIRERFRRLKVSGCPLRRASRATSPNASHWRRKERGVFPPPREAWGRWIAASSRRDGGGSSRLAFSAQPRAPPTISVPHSLPPHLSAPARLRTPTLDLLPRHAMLPS